MRIACLQLNSTVGAFESNADKLITAYERAMGKGAELAIAPELFLSGYPAADLFTRTDFIEANERALWKVADCVGDVPLILGTFRTNPERPGKPLFNSAVIIRDGKIISTTDKTLLPTYDVFDEDRYFESGKGGPIFEHNGWRIGLTVCEDLWNDKSFWQNRIYHIDPVDELARQAVDLVVNVSASPWHVGKERLRGDMLSRMASDHKFAIIQVNLAGATDELLFDGQSMVINDKGEIIGIGNAFDEDVFAVDLRKKEPLSIQWPDHAAQLFYGLAMGVKDYVEKTGFEKVVLGLSGGIDSAVTAAIAVEALGPDRVLGVAMPSPYSSDGSLADARALADVLEIELHVIPIHEIFNSLKCSLAPSFGNTPEDVTEENMQSRIRGDILMAIANKQNRLLLTTGNKSELATGYCTLYGDMCGALAVLSDLLKGQVYEIANWLNRHVTIIPTSSITKPPSAELKPNQTDQDTLPPYDILDQIVHAYIVEEKDVQTIGEQINDLPLARKITRLIDQNEYKRRQAAPGLKVSPKAFGRGRRRPIAQQFHP